jgi:hypothetical protein
MSARELPARPNLDQYKKQAKELSEGREVRRRARVRTHARTSSTIQACVG